MELKDFIDFAYTMVNMDEIKNDQFVLPKEIIFMLDKDQHKVIHGKLKSEKGDFSSDSLEDDFEVDIFGITFRFKS